MATLEHTGEWGRTAGSKLGWMIAGRLATALLLSVIATLWTTAGQASYSINKSLGLLSGLLVTGKMCEYAEDSIVDNFITEMKKKENGISSKAPKTIENIEASNKFSASFNFVTYVTSKAFLNLIM